MSSSKLIFNISNLDKNIQETDISIFIRSSIIHSIISIVNNKKVRNAKSVNNKIEILHKALQNSEPLFSLFFGIFHYVIVQYRSIVVISSKSIIAILRKLFYSFFEFITFVI